MGSRTVENYISMEKKKSQEIDCGANFRDLHNFFLAEFILHEIFNVNGAVDKPVYYIVCR